MVDDEEASFSEAISGGAVRTEQVANLFRVRLWRFTLCAVLDRTVEKAMMVEKAQKASRPN